MYMYILHITCICNYVYITCTCNIYVSDVTVHNNNYVYINILQECLNNGKHTKIYK